MNVPGTDLSATGEEMSKTNTFLFEAQSWERITKVVKHIYKLY